MTHNRLFVLASAFLAASIILSTSTAVGEKANLSEPTNLTNPSIPGQQMDPASIVYQGLLYLFWASNTAEVGSYDFDIVYSTFDRNVWSQHHIITADDAGNDYTPQPVLFNGNLYLFWSSDDVNTTGGTNADIVVSSFNGGSWTEPVSLTHGFGSLGDYNPCSVVYNSQLYVFFEWYSIQSNVYEIAFARLGDSWAQPVAITNASTGHNLNPTVAVTGESLILAWESSSPGLTGSAASSIISRTLAGDQWSGFVSVSGDAGPANLDPCAVAFSGSVWVFWSTNSPAISNGNDYDIVGRLYTSGAWNGTVFEIASQQDSGDDMGIAAATHGDKLILSWISGSPEYSGGSDTDIVMAIFDSSEWSNPIDVSRDDGREDGGGYTFKTPTLCSFDGESVTVWETNASPDITVSQSTWLIVVGCEFSDDGGFFSWWLSIPLILVVAVIAVLMARRKRRSHK